MSFVKVAGPDELRDGEVRAVTVDGVPVALIRLDGLYGALHGVCPHAGGPLGEGALEFGVLVCPWHGREFHPLTGECQGYLDHVAAYPVVVRDDGIYVDVAG